MKIKTKYSINDSVIETRHKTNEVSKIVSIIIDEDGVTYKLSNSESDLYNESELTRVEYI